MACLGSAYTDFLEEGARFRARVNHVEQAFAPLVPARAAVLARPLASTGAWMPLVGYGTAVFRGREREGRLPLAVFLRDEGGAVVGGISGYTAWGWIYVQWLWLAEDQRGQGAAGRMLEAAEAEARRRGCHGAWIDTFNPVALRAYQRAGYRIFGALPEFPRGRTRTFLRKSLT